MAALRFVARPIRLAAVAWWDGVLFRLDVGHGDRCRCPACRVLRREIEHDAAREW